MDIVILLWSSGDTRTLGPCLENRSRRKKDHAMEADMSVRHRDKQPVRSKVTLEKESRKPSMLGRRGPNVLMKACLEKRYRGWRCYWLVPLIPALGGRGRQISSLKTSLIITEQTTNQARNPFSEKKKSKKYK